MRIDQIKELVKILEESQVAEIEVSHFGSRIRVSKGTNPASPAGVAPVSPGPSLVVPAPEASPAPPPLGGQPTALETVAIPPRAPTVEAKPHFVIKSPMVGTFYRAPAPDAPPYVEVGDIVKVGQTVCIIEAMKLMNEIESEKSGQVVRILPENAQPVEFDQELFWIEPV